MNGNEFESACRRQRLSGSFPEGKSSTALADCGPLDDSILRVLVPGAKGREMGGRARSLRSSKE